jgi:hypothetical protein
VPIDAVGDRQISHASTTSGSTSPR